MDPPDFSRPPAGDGDCNFEFVSDSSNFSDRPLRIEIVAGPPKGRPDGEGDSEWDRHRKRRRDAIEKRKDEQEGEAVAMIEESPSGDEPSRHSGSSWSMDSPPVISIKSLSVSSTILSAKSPFFYKLFSNGMQESDQQHATLRIDASEEAALMELLSFMYSGKLSTTSPTLLLDVLMVADKFEVVSCMRHCCQLLKSLPMSQESALLYLELPSSISMASALQPLTEAAKEFLVNSFKDVTKNQDGLVELPLVGMEAVLSSDDVQVASEDALYDLVLKWARRHHPKLEERQEVFGARLGRLIRFPYMSSRKLRKVLTHNDLDQEFTNKAVLEALFFKVEPAHRRQALAMDDVTNRRFVERAYKYRPVKVVEFEVPNTQCIVYLDLKREECAHLFPSGRVYSQAFYIGGQGFFLSAHCNRDVHNSCHCFGLFLGMQDKGSVSFTVDYEFSARTMPSGQFDSKYKEKYTFAGGKAVGYRNLFALPWTSFMADDSPYFINGVLHLRAELTIESNDTFSAAAQ